MSDPIFAQQMLVLGDSPQGRLLRKYLWERLSFVVPPHTEAGALHDHNGVRRLARELLDLLEAEATDANAAPDPSVRPSVGQRREPAVVRGPRGAERRVFARDPGGGSS
jgi:hypothetical protein